MWKYSGQDVTQEIKKETNFPKNTGGGQTNKENMPKIEGGRYMAIQALTPYMNKWTIKGKNWPPRGRDLKESLKMKK